VLEMRGGALVRLQAEDAAALSGRPGRANEARVAAPASRGTVLLRRPLCSTIIVIAMRCRFRLFLVCALGALAVPGWARDQLDTDTLARFGGSYATECGKPSAPRLRVQAEALVVERGNQRLVGSEPRAAYSYLGASAPRSFQVALLSQVRGGSELTFMMHRDRGGNYIELEADPDVRAALGPGFTGQRYRQCGGPPATAGAGPAASPVPQSPSAARNSPEKLLADARFRRTWRGLLGAHAREPWLARMDGPAPEPRWVYVGSSRYVLHAFCKPHDCHDNSAVMLYSPTDLRIHAWVHRGQGAMLIGNPSPAMAAELQRLWRSEWRAPPR
jgi:hypothetical protein